MPDQPDAREPQEGDHQRNVVNAPGVISAKINGHAGGDGTDGIKQGSAKKVAVDGSPGARAAPPDDGGTSDKNKVFQEVNQIKAAAVQIALWRHVLPRDNDEKVEIKPPG